MKRFLVVFLAVACGGDDSGSGSWSALKDPTAITDPLAQGVTITEIALFQGTKVPIAKGGGPADHSGVPIVAGRDGLLRIYVSGGSGKDVTPKIRIETNGPTGSWRRTIVGKPKKISGAASTDGALDSTINVDIPGILLAPGANITVVLTQPDGDKPTAEPSPARFPQDGSAAPLGAKPGGETLKVVAVPVKISGVAPDVEALVKPYHDIFYSYYPAAAVDIKARDPFDYTGAASMDAILMAVCALRGNDAVPNDVYYYGVIGGAGGGLGTLGGGCGVGSESPGVALHEIGHAHGISHAPCGGAAGPDPKYPYPEAAIGAWGYDLLSKQLHPPEDKDFMSYCGPTWISDYNWNLIFMRVKGDHGYYGYGDVQLPQKKTSVDYRVIALREDGNTINATWGFATSDEHRITMGDSRTVTLTHDDGSIETVTGYFSPYDKMPGGWLMVPERSPIAALAVPQILGHTAPTFFTRN